VFGYTKLMSTLPVLRDTSFQGGEDTSLLGCDAVWWYRTPTFRRSLLLLSSGWQQYPPKLWYPVITALHDVTTYKDLD